MSHSLQLHSKFSLRIHIALMLRIKWLSVSINSLMNPIPLYAFFPRMMLTWLHSFCSARHTSHMPLVRFLFTELSTGSQDTGMLPSRVMDCLTFLFSGTQPDIISYGTCTINNVLLIKDHRCFIWYSIEHLVCSKFMRLWDCGMNPCMLGLVCQHRWRWHLVAPQSHSCSVRWLVRIPAQAHECMDTDE